MGSSENQPPAPQRSRMFFPIMLLAVGGSLAAAALLGGPGGIGGGATVASLEVTSAGTAATFSVAEAGTLQVWADIDISYGDISTGTSSSDLPHVVDWVVTLEGEGEAPVELRCNPFNSNFARTSGGTSPMGAPNTRSYDGLIRDCAFAVTPGTYTIRVQAEPNRPDARIIFQKKVMILRSS